jgi:hypothetical protein
LYSSRSSYLHHLGYVRELQGLIIDCGHSYSLFLLTFKRQTFILVCQKVVLVINPNSQLLIICVWEAFGQEKGLLKCGFWLMGCCRFCFIVEGRTYMGHHQHPVHYQSYRRHHDDGGSTDDDPFLTSCCCPCFLVCSFFRGIRRCIFVACYPVFFKCFGWDD